MTLRHLLPRALRGSVATLTAHLTAAPNAPSHDHGMKHRLRQAGSVGAVALLLSACGGNDGASTGSAASGAAAVSTAATRATTFAAPADASAEGGRIGLAAAASSASAAGAERNESRTAARAAVAQVVPRLDAAALAAAQPADAGKLDASLLELAAPASGRASILAAPTGARITAAHPVVETTRGVLVEVEATAADPTALRAALRELGLVEEAVTGRLVTGWLSRTQLQRLESLSGVKRARGVPPPVSNLGAVNSEADVVMLANRVRNDFRVTGRGVRIGIISVSYDLLGGAAAGVASGDLPGPANPNGFRTPVTVVQEGQTGIFPAAATDEGRAMAELIHDIAPDAQLFVYGIRGGTPALLAAAVQALADRGVDIIVDDIGTDRGVTPAFQDDLASQTIDRVVAQRRIAYFTSAGNAGRNRTREILAPEFFNFFEPTASFATLNLGPVGSNTPVFAVNAPTTGTTWRVRVIVQYDDPSPSTSTTGAGVRSPIRLLVIGPSGNQLLSEATVVGGEPTLQIVGSNLSVRDFPSLRFAVLQPTGTPPVGAVRIFIDSTGTTDASFPLDGPTIYGHNGAAGAISVGSASWFNTPVGAGIWNRFFTPIVSTPQTAILSAPGQPVFGNRSSVGGGQIRLDTAGNRLAQPVVRQAPAVVAPDGSPNTFFGDTYQNARLFFGTSASAPNAAAVGALLLQASRGRLDPAALRGVLTSTAEDMDDPYANGIQTNPNDPLFTRGFDFASGFGLVRADAALNAVRTQYGTDALGVEPVCEDRVKRERRWRLLNPNGFGVSAELRVSGTVGSFRFDNQTAYASGPRTRVVAPGGELFFVPNPSGLVDLTNVNLSWSPFPASGTGSASNTKVGGWTACP